MMVLLRQQGKVAAILWIDLHLAEEGVHGLFVDDWRVFGNVVVGFVHGCVFGGDGIWVDGRWDEGDDAFETCFQLGVFHGFVGQAESEGAAGTAADGVDFLVVCAEG